MSTSSPSLVIAGVSGARSSRCAVRTAAAEAAARGYALRLVHAFNWLPSGTTPAASRQLLSRAADQATRAAPGLTVMTELVEGAPLYGLLRRSRDAVLAVIGDGDLDSHVCLPRDTLPVQFTARAAVTVMVTRGTPHPAARSWPVSAARATPRPPSMSRSTWRRTGGPG